MCAVVRTFRRPDLNAAFAGDNLLLGQRGPVNREEDPDGPCGPVKKSARVADLVDAVVADHLVSGPGLAAVKATHHQRVDVTGIAERSLAAFQHRDDRSFPG
jgi:hypothetical protein